LIDRYKGSVSKAVLANLAPDGYISPHRDLMPILQRIHRCHLPILTGAEVEFVLDGEVKHLAAGTLYEINNQCEHSVFNGMNTGRVHLIVDILPDNGETVELISLP
jgi:aspartyl/asparaginyl beta-hydroxylase (cupin superfamily)